MTERIKKTVKPTAVVLAIGFIYFLIHNLTGFSVPCPFHFITKLYCPGCGVSRMILSALKLDFKTAFLSNPVLFCLAPVFAGFFVWHIYRYIRFGDRSFYKWENVLLYIVIGVLLIFGVLRNFIPLGMPAAINF